MADQESASACATCEKTEEQNGKPLLRCASCHNVSYCDKDCQKSDWKAHKNDCTFKPKPKSSASSTGAGQSRSPKAAMESIMGFNTASMLRDQPEKEVFKLLIDSFRMRVEDECNFRGDILHDSALGEGNPVAGFRRYLKKAETRKGVMPTWWNAEKREACVAFGRKKDHWWRLDSAVEKSDIQEQWANNSAPMQLRMLAEEIVGSHVVG